MIAKYGTHQTAIKHGELPIRLLMTKSPAVRIPAKFAARQSHRVYPAFELRLSLTPGFNDAISRKVTALGYHFARCFARDRQTGRLLEWYHIRSAGLLDERIECTIRFLVALAFIPKLYIIRFFFRYKRNYHN